MDKETLIKEIYDGVKIFAYKQAYNQEQAKDFLQEGLISALEAIDKYPDKSDEELVLIIARSAYNRIYSIQAKDITYSRRYPSSIENLCICAPSDVEMELENKDFLTVLRSRLKRRERQILDERLNPSKKTLLVQEAEKKEKLKKRKKGMLVMNLNKDIINDTHIAKSMQVSKASISRGFKAIQQEAQVLFENLPLETE